MAEDSLIHFPQAILDRLIKSKVVDKSASFEFNQNNQTTRLDQINSLRMGNGSAFSAYLLAIKIQMNKHSN